MIKIDGKPTLEKVETLMKIIHAELEELTLAGEVSGAKSTTTPTIRTLNEKKGGEKGEKKGEKGSGKQGGSSTWKEPCRYFGEKGCMWGRQCTAYHRRAKQDECINCGSTLHRTADCGRPKEPRTEKGQGKNEKGEGKGKGEKRGEHGGKTGWKGQSQWGQGSWTGNSKGGERGKENGKGDEVKNAVKLALEKNKEEEKEKKDQEDERTKATEKENEAKEKGEEGVS